MLTLCARNYLSYKLHGQGYTIFTCVTLQSVVTVLVLSNLDYCNAILSGATDFQRGRLQRLQNRAARLITRLLESVTETTSHWFLKNCIGFR